MRAPSRGFLPDTRNHPGIGIESDNHGSSPLPSRQSQRTVTAANVQHPPVGQLANKAQDKPLLQLFGNRTKRRRAPFGIDLGANLAGIAADHASQMLNVICQASSDMPRHIQNQCRSQYFSNRTFAACQR